MTKRRHDASRHPEGPAVSPGDFPALSEFFGGYFHQDLVPVHGSAGRAARAFSHDADAARRATVRQELRLLIERLRGHRRTAVRQALETLGAAWAPAAVADLEALLDDLGEPAPNQDRRGEE
jgi:hypothetical protein